MTWILIILLLLLLAAGAPIFSVMLGFALLGVMATGRGFADFAAGAPLDVAFGNGSLALATIPLFIFCGYVMAESKTADRMVRFANALLGWVPGGLAVVTIFACAIFTTFSGASGVTIVALGGLVMPALLKEQYPERFSLGLVAGTGSVGLLFPPALPLVVYGIVWGMNAQGVLAAQGHGESLTLIKFTLDRFLFAGIVPGLVLIGMLSLFAVTIAIFRRVPRQKFVFSELLRALIVGLPEMALPFLIIFALVTGYQISEVAALTAVYVLAVEMLLFRDIKARHLWKICRESMSLVGAIFIIIFASAILTDYFTYEQVPNKILGWIGGHIDSKWTFLLALNLVLLVVGMLMDIFSAIVVVVPLIVPAAIRYGVDPYHLGIIFLLNLEIGYLTPPVGLNLFITGFKFKKPIVEVVKASTPFLLIMMVALVLVTYVPALTVVPEAERTGRVATILTRVDQARERMDKVQEISLPDGTTLRLDGCAKLEGLRQGECRALFSTVTECRKAAGGAADSACESDAIKAYLEASAPAEDDFGFTLDDDDGSDLSLDDDSGDPTLDGAGDPTLDGDSADDLPSTP